ncbi:MAG: glycosyltransferase [Candidatus Aminicenantes bacterium]|nr:glycosyltransferase [Candidatus Aminicenantes bacterium]NIM84224.1 glycosyltransferase [Candidatus Aminicenantes bacterium]NIN23673.1 glycosyltransferase [Candidatus Aminicenantes bacterium]NIN47380.1 glycosyltransferase [Candidatus Aminicenantes bacterium]NIN90308.1 glycosyltransferase [Candidatus Aminicenantes bacterium]
MIDKKMMIITNIPNPYRIPLFNELNVQLKQRGIKLKVVFGARGYSRRKFQLDMEECQFDYTILKSSPRNIFFAGKTWFTYSGLLKLIRQERPDQIIIIGFSLGTIKLWLRSFRVKTPIIIWSGTIPTSKHSFLRRMQRKLIMKRVSGYIAYGSKAKEYLVSLGADPGKVHIAINTVDTTFFSSKTFQLRQELDEKGNKKHLTSIGYLIPRKNVFRVLEVVKLLAETRNDFILDLIGDGSDKKKLERFVADNGISSFVKFHGFRQTDELPFFLARSRCFLFQTDFDIWGLVLNEAMAAGIPCISSIHAGATHDLIIEGETGFAMDFADTGKVAECLNWILEYPDKARQIGDNAGKFIREHASLEKCVEGFIKVIEPIKEK